MVGSRPRCPCRVRSLPQSASHRNIINNPAWTAMEPAWPRWRWDGVRVCRVLARDRAHPRVWHHRSATAPPPVGHRLTTLAQEIIAPRTADPRRIPAGDWRPPIRDPGQPGRSGQVHVARLVCRRCAERMIEDGYSESTTHSRVGPARRRRRFLVLGSRSSETPSAPLPSATPRLPRRAGEARPPAGEAVLFPPPAGGRGLGGGWKRELSAVRLLDA